MKLLARLTTCSVSTLFVAIYEVQVAVFLLTLALAKFRHDKHNGDFDLGAEPPHFSLVFAGFSECEQLVSAVILRTDAEMINGVFDTRPTHDSDDAKQITAEKNDNLKQEV